MTSKTDDNDAASEINLNVCRRKSVCEEDCCSSPTLPWCLLVSVLVILFVIVGTVAHFKKIPPSIVYADEVSSVNRVEMAMMRSWHRKQDAKKSAESRLGRGIIFQRNPYEDIANRMKLSPDSTKEELEDVIKSMANYFHTNRCKAGSAIAVTRRTASGGYEQAIVPSGVMEVGRDDKPVTEDTLFEIGSIPKPITGLILADQITRGTLSLDTTLNSLLPDTVPKLVVDGSQITLRHMVTHTSGFTRESRETCWLLLYTFCVDPSFSPYEGRTIDEFLQLIKIASQELETRTSAFSYSNFGMNVLAYGLARHAGTTFEALHGSLTLSLGLNSTFAGQSHEDHLSTGHSNSGGTKRRHWFKDGLEIIGSGGTISSSKDLISLSELLIKAQSDETTNDDVPLLDALNLSLTPLNEVEPNFGNAFNWFYGIPDSDNTFYDHGGAMLGFLSSAVFQPSSHVGVVGLSNCGVPSGLALASCAITSLIGYCQCQYDISDIVSIIASKLV